MSDESIQSAPIFLRLFLMGVTRFISFVRSDFRDRQPSLEPDDGFCTSIRLVVKPTWLMNKGRQAICGRQSRQGTATHRSMDNVPPDHDGFTP